MEIQLDIRTLSFVTVLFSFVYGIGLLCVDIFQKGLAGIRQLGQGILVTGVGFLLLGLRAIVPDWISILLANALIFAGFVLISKSVSIFMGFVPIKPRIELALGALLVLLFILNTYVMPSVLLRIVWINLFLAFQTVICAAYIFRGKTSDPVVARVMTALPFICASLFLVFRALWVISEGTLHTFMSAGVIHQLGFLVINFLILTVSFGFLWMTSARLGEKLRRQARIDTLTRTYNRRALEDLSLREMARATRHSLPLSVVMLDIDHFKRLNDNFGHQVGDMVLTNLAVILKDNLREQDLVVRFGGDEFLLLFPDTSLTQAIRAAEKLQIRIRETFLVIEREVKATISLGVAELRPGEAWDSLVSRADAALYQAKQQGRAQVVGA